MTPNGDLLKKTLWRNQGLINLCTIVWIDGWPTDGFKDVAKSTLNFTPKSKVDLYKVEDDDKEGGNAGLKLLGIVA